MSDIQEFFRENQDAFTVYVVEQRFVVGRGYEYFKSFKGKENYISSEKDIKKNISKVLRWIQKNTPNIGDIIKNIIKIESKITIIELISSLSKLFTVNEHQAVGPEVLDPIILQEGSIDSKYLSQLIALHKDSILQPTIIILLKDNDFERAKKLLSQCPHGMNAKMIRNSGQTEIFKVINTGSDSIESFLDAFARQCFSTCSRTKRGILLNDGWASNSMVRLFSPSMFKIRTNLLLDEKDEVGSEINDIISSLECKSKEHNSIDDEKLLQSLLCMAKLFRIYCLDAGGNDIFDAFELAKELNNELLLAHVYRYSFFLNNAPFNQRQEMLLNAKDIFQKNNIEDHAIYCMNNYLNQNMYSDTLNLRPYKELLEEAIYNVPGLVGMSYIYNNTGVACIYSGKSDEAINMFEKGLDYAKDRIVPWLALQSNKLIAKELSGQTINESEIVTLLNRVFDVMGLDRLPFISSNIVTNCISIACKHYPELSDHIVRSFPVARLYNKALISGQMGSGSLYEQFKVISSYDSDGFFKSIQFPNQKSKVGGIRLKYIKKYGLNPVIFHTWL